MGQPGSTQIKSGRSQSKLDPWHFIHERTQNSNQLVTVEWSSGPLKKKENKLMTAKMKSPTAAYFSKNTRKTKR
jgi:hypothetical protein